MLTLLLTLTWVLPAGAVGQLDEGDVSVDKDYVSPTVTSGTDMGVGARTVEVTLENSDLTSTESVRVGGDLGAVTIAFAGTEAAPTIDSTHVRRFRIRIMDESSGAEGGTTNITGVTVARPTDDDNATRPADAVLPIVGAVTVQTGASATSRTTAAKVGTPTVVNAKTGLIEFPVLADLFDETIHLSYDTSNSETALVNVRGETDFDLLLVETSDQGKYSETFVVNEPDNVLLNPGVTPADAADVLDGVQYGIVHEQHSIPSGLRGNVNIENESISTFYYVAPNTDTGATNADAWDASRGTLTGAQAYLNAISSLSDPDNVDSERGLPSGQTFYARVANPPIVTTVADNAELTNTNQDIRHDGPTGLTVTLVSKQQGILSFSDSANVFDGFSGGDIEIDYVGSDSFEIAVEHGINLTGVTDLASFGGIVLTDAVTAVAAGNIRIGLPTTDDDTAAPDANTIFDIVSITDDGSNCYDCRLRIGVITTPADGGSEAAPLKSRYSVMAISYSGLERVDITDNLDDTTGRGTFTSGADPEVDLTATANGTNNIVPATLLFEPADIDPDMDGVQTDIEVVRTSDSVLATPGALATTDITVVSVNGRRIQFRVNTSDLDAEGTPPQATDGDHFDITYTRKVGALPRNALNPDIDDVRPVVAVDNGGRIRISSANDTTAVDAETDGPIFTNAMPAHKSGTASNDEMLSIDVTDDLAGVDEGSIKFMVKAGGAATRTVINSDLTITEIDGGFRASIALDEVRHNGTGSKLNVSTSRETAINWYAMAEDEAGNMGSSDSNKDKRDDAEATDKYADCSEQSAGSNDCYTFTVDGVSPVMQRAYTGDWFNEAMERVEGDRRVSRRNYLPGSSRNTSIRVVFNEPIDPASVSADDFTVDGSVPDDADAYSSGSTDGANGEDVVNGVIGRSVFLTVPAMGTGDTPMVELTGNVSDLAGNETTSGSETANDGLAPNGTLSVNTAIHKKTVIVTVETDEAVRLQSPDLLLWVSDAVDTCCSEELDEVDTFTVERQTPDDDTSSLVIRDDSTDEIVFEGNLNDRNSALNVTLSSAPILDRNSDGMVNDSDIIAVEVVREGDDASQAVTNVVTKRTGAGEKTVVNGKTGRISLNIRGDVPAVEASDGPDGQANTADDIAAAPAVDPLALVIRYESCTVVPAPTRPTSSVRFPQCVVCPSLAAPILGPMSWTLIVQTGSPSPPRWKTPSSTVAWVEFPIQRRRGYRIRNRQPVGWQHRHRRQYD